MERGERGGKGEKLLAGFKRCVGFIVRQLEARKHRLSLKNPNIPSEEPGVFILSFHLSSH